MRSPFSGRKSNGTIILNCVFVYGKSQSFVSCIHFHIYPSLGNFDVVHLYVLMYPGPVALRNGAWLPLADAQPQLRCNYTDFAERDSGWRWLGAENGAPPSRRGPRVFCPSVLSSFECGLLW